jgi:hypothetical protein
MELLRDPDGLAGAGVYGCLSDEPLVRAAGLEEGIPGLDVTGDGDGVETRGGLVLVTPFRICAEFVPGTCERLLVREGVWTVQPFRRSRGVCLGAVCGFGCPTAISSSGGLG